MQWSDAVTRNEGARDAQAFAALRRHFDDDEIVEITWLCGMFNMLNRVHDSLHLDIELPDEVARIGRSARVPREAVVRWASGLTDLLHDEIAESAVTVD